MSATEHDDAPARGAGDPHAAAKPPSSPVLPALDDDAVDRLETAVFARIASDRRAAAAAHTRRTHRRAWVGLGSAAAVVVVAAFIAPAVGSIVSPGSAGGSAGSVAVDEASVPMMGADAAGSAPDAQQESMDVAAEPGAGSAARGDAATAAGTDVQAGRDIVASASASLTVDDIADAADEIVGVAQQYGGYVENLSVGSDGGVVPLAEDTGAIYPGQPRAGNGWVSVRVPAEQLQAAIDGLDAVGAVSSVSITRSDVTDQAIDLRARVAATSASVGRLTELMTQSGSVADLISAEVALSDRQALLESYEQQLAQLDSQVALSSLSVQLSVDSEPVSADPAGFGEGLTAGWNALVASLNGVVIAIGFLLPWIVVVGVAALLVRLIVGAIRRRSAQRAPRVDQG